MKNVVVLGSTGSIGTSTLKVAEDLPDRIRLLALAAGNNVDLLIEQTRKHQPVAVSMNDPAKAEELRGTLGANCEVYSGTDGLVKLATLPDADIVLHCKMGGRSAKAQDILYANGFTNVKNMVGGITRWADEVDPSIPKY